MSSWIKNVVDRIKDLNGSVDNYRKDSIIQSIPTVAYVNKAKKLIENKTRVVILGERSNLSDKILTAIKEVEDLTKDFTSYTLGICFNYGGRQEIVHAAKEICKKVMAGQMSIDDININSFEENLYTYGIDPVDLMIRTSGEERLSNFLPWQLAYSEFIFSKCYWPDFNRKELFSCIDVYQSRNRRFGGLENKNVK